MEPKQSGEHYGAASQLIERQMLLHGIREKAATASLAGQTSFRYRFITISRDIGSLGDTIAQETAKCLGWKICDREIVDHVARDGHVRQSIVEQLDERDRNIIHETVRRLLRMAEGGSFGMAEYHESLIRSLAYLAAQGNVVLVGRGSNFVLHRELGGMHVRIVASPAVRTQRLSMRWHVTPAEARWRMQEIDAERRHFIRRYFRQNIDDLAAYDIVFNTDHMTPQQVARSILEAIKTPIEKPAAGSVTQGKKPAVVVNHPAAG